jgi:hypothetical protein
MALALLATSATPAAPAATVVRLHGTVAGAPVWWDGHALVAARSRRGYVVQEVDPTSSQRTPVAVVATAAYNSAVRLAASPSLIAFAGVSTGCPREGGGCRYYDYEVERQDVYAGPPGGPLHCVSTLAARGCPGRAQCPQPAPMAGSSAGIVFQTCRNPAREEAVLLGAPAVAPGLVQALPSIALPVAASGPWLVGLAPGWAEELSPEGEPLRPARPVLIERNLLTGAEPLQIALPEGRYAPSAESPGFEPVVAVQEDGQLVYATATGGATTLWTASPAAPTPRSVATIPLVVELTPGRGRPEGKQLVLAGDRVAFRGPEPGPRRFPAITVEALSGTVLGSLPEPGLEGFDFDGRQVVATSTPCEETFLETWEPGEPAPELGAHGCPLPTISRRVTLTRRAITVTVSCPAEPPLGCAGVWVEATAGLNRHREPSMYAESLDQEISPGASRRIALPLGSSDRRWLARHRHARVALRVLVGGSAEESTTNERTIVVRLP